MIHLGHPLDRDGHLRNVAEPRTVHPAYARAVSAAVTGFGRVATPHDSLLLRGSVANGTARAGTSDMDLVWVADPPPRPPALRTLADVVGAAAPAGTFVDVCPVRPHDIANIAHGWAELVVNLATSSIVLAGPPPLVPACRPGWQLARALYPQGVRPLADMLQALRAGDSPGPYAGRSQPRSFWLTWLARDLIRCAGAAVMALDGRYSRDLSTCVELVGDVDRRTAECLSIGLGWAVHAPDDPETILPWAASCIDRVGIIWHSANA